MKRKFQTLSSILAVALFGFLAFGSDDEESASSNEPSQTEKILVDETLTQAQKDSLLAIEKQKEIEARENNTISARNLYRQYEANEVSADNNFKGKKFYVEGVVEDISKDILDEIFVRLKTGEIIGSVQCYLNDADAAAQLQKGQRITVYGTCEGVMMNVMMKNCDLVKNKSDL